MPFIAKVLAEKYDDLAATGWQPTRTLDEIRATLSAATRLLFPDPQRATAGIHFMKVLQALGLVWIRQVVAPDVPFINLVAYYPMIAVRTESDYKDIHALIADAKANPGKIRVGSPGERREQEEEDRARRDGQPGEDAGHQSAGVSCRSRRTSAPRPASLASKS